jgi:hypothetical protein
MKGVSQTLWLVVAAVVIVVVALVVITIFGGGISQFASITEGKAYCSTVGTPVCQMSFGNQQTSPPASWSSNNIKIGDDTTSCQSLCPWSFSCTKV